MAGTQDPNYMTLANVADPFANKPKPKAAAPMAGTQDPNYMTLANVADPFANKPKSKAAAPMAGTQDPNYMVCIFVITLVCYICNKMDRHYIDLQDYQRCN